MTSRDGAVERLAQLVEEVSGNVVGEAQLPSLEAIGLRRAAERGFGDLERYVGALSQSSLPDEWRQLLPLITVKESFFFRTAEHFRAIWEAQREVQMELFEAVMEHWTEDAYPRWASDPAHTPELWQIAWDGEKVAGMVLNRIDTTANAAHCRKRGYTEHVFVRRPWRGRGLASALLARSLELLKAQGMEEAELGVDVENASGAHALYERMGFRTFSTDIWFRKPMASLVRTAEP